MTSEPELRRFFNALVTRLDFVAITLDAENPYKPMRCPPKPSAGMAMLRKLVE